MIPTCKGQSETHLALGLVEESTRIRQLTQVSSRILGLHTIVMSANTELYCVPESRF